MRFLFVLPPGSLLLFFACGGDDTVAPPADDAGVDAQDMSVPDTSAPPDAADAADAAPARIIYAHSNSDLYRFDPATYELTHVGTFSCAVDLVFNIAVNADAQIYGTTSEGFVAINSNDASCFPIAKGVYPRSLAFLPKGMVDPDHEVLVGYNYAQYVSIDPATGALTPIGAINPNATGKDYTVSGDLVALPGATGRIYVSVLGGPTGDQLVEADPKTGKALRVISHTSQLDLLGLGQWAGTGYAFSAAGKAFAFDFQEGGTTQVWPVDASDDSSLSFSGAGVTTRAPVQ